MDQFEMIARSLLERDGYWVRQSFKINLTKAQKAALGPNQRSIPRPEIDLLAIHLGRREVVAFEVKSFFDSTGVVLQHLKDEYPHPKGEYKLFTCAPYRKALLEQLRLDLITCGLLTPDWTNPIKLGMIAGKVRQGDAKGIADLFSKQGWVFWPPATVKTKVEGMAKERYENDAAVITAKILLR